MNNLNTKMRRIGSREEPRIFSQQSVLSAMDRFVLAVDNMNETVMVPSRLMDMSADTKSTTTTNSSPPPPSSLDLHAFYTMLNSVKTELIWGIGSDNLDNSKNKERRTGTTMMMMTPTTNNSTSIIHQQQQQPITATRRLSTVSSLSLSESETDTESCSESDSGLESYDDHSSTVARNFRYHLNGLYGVLQQLTDAADILTCKYQEEVGGAS